MQQERWFVLYEKPIDFLAMLGIGYKFCGLKPQNSELLAVIESWRGTIFDLLTRCSTLPDKDSES